MNGSIFYLINSLLVFLLWANKSMRVGQPGKENPSEIMRGSGMEDRTVSGYVIYIPFNENLACMECLVAFHLNF